MEDVPRQSDVGHDVEHRYRKVAQRLGNIVVRVAGHEVVAQPPAPSQVSQVVEDEQGDDRTGPAHGPAGVGGSQVIPTALIFLCAADPSCLLAGVTAHPAEGDSRVEVKHEHAQQPQSEKPENGSLWDQAPTQSAQRLGVLVHPGRALVHVEVADHVNQNETDQP